MPTSPSPDSPNYSGPLLGYKSPNAYEVYNDGGPGGWVDWILFVVIVGAIYLGGLLVYTAVRAPCPHAVQPADCEVRQR